MAAGLHGSVAEEAAWEQGLKRLELGYEDEVYCNLRLQLGQEEHGHSCTQLQVCTQSALRYALRPDYG